MVYRVYVNAQELFQDGVEKVNIQVMCGPRCNGLTCANVAAAPGAAPASPASLYFGTYNATAASGAGRFVVCLLPACTSAASATLSLTYVPRMLTYADVC